MNGKRLLLYGLVFAVFAFMMSGCIPPNEHVGKPPPHSYKDPYYYDGYYYHGGGGYYYR